MRKAQKQQIEETIRQMEEAHDEIKRCIENRAAAQAGELLADCQNAAIAMGTLIEDMEGEGHPAVTILEEYCEQVYQIHECLSSDSSVNSVNAVNPNKIYKSLRQKLIKASNSIRNDIKIRTEAVFLPYKASMWDSLESVWKAADADPDCDAYVIPIPYFDKNPDGSFREIHYEGDQYPDYVPITRYDAFDFGKHMPDVIYIHNAYDDWNLVTSVHPDFYSKNLKKYTDKLVYIPYFVLSEIDSDNEQAAEGMKHFCFMPGIINADKVIVQSENMKKIYVREYLKAAKKCGLTGKHLDKTYLEKKFMGTGSPKFDKVLNTKKEDLEIPAEWLKVIEKPDGSWKKIVFYNTSVGALLSDEEKLLKKMESVFGIFKENRNEVALLWRPHPLIQATIKSMRPELWKAFAKLRDHYIEEGWGIYDDSADVDRALVLSDAYYGVGSSSVVQLYRKTGKPMMIQDINVLSVQKKIVLSTYDIANMNQKIYFAAKNIFGFFMYDRQTEALKQIAINSFILNDISSRFTFGGTCVYKGKVFFAPHAFSKGLLYDNDTLEGGEQIVDMNVFVSKREENYYVKRAVPFENWIYFISHKESNMLCMDMDTMCVRIIDFWQKHPIIDVRTRGFSGVNTGGDVCIVGDSFFVPINYDNYILEVNMRTQNTSIYKINTHAMRFFTICFDGISFWLTGYEPAVVKWNKEDGSIEIFNDFPEGFYQFKKDGYWEELFSRSFYENGYVYLFPLTANMVLKVNTDNGHVKKLYQWEVLSSCYTVEKWDKNTFYIEVGDENYIDINGSMLMDTSGNILKRDIFTISPKDVKYTFQEKEMGNYVETSAFTLRDFILRK